MTDNTQSKKAIRKEIRTIPQDDEQHKKRSAIRKEIRKIVEDGQVHTNQEVYAKIKENPEFAEVDKRTILTLFHHVKKDNLRIKPVGDGYQVKQATVIEFRQMADQLISPLEKFDWVNCSQAELVRARETVHTLQEIADRINAIK